jgi:hypothetical protein
MRRLFFASVVLLTVTVGYPAAAQAPGANSDDPIVVEGQRGTEDRPSVVTKLRRMIDESSGDQLARFEAEICPVVIGMPADWTAILTRIIRENVVAAGGKIGREGCSVNAAAISIDQPQELLWALNKEEPSFFMNMSPREFDQFSGPRRAAYSWHTSNTYTKDGAHMDKVTRFASATRLYTNVREEMESGLVVIDRRATIGKSLRQLADFATMHLMLDVNWRSPHMDRSSILSLFHSHDQGPPMRMSSFDRNALSGFYLQRENNRTADQQRQNIARAIERQEAGKPAVGTKKEE